MIGLKAVSNVRGHVASTGSLVGKVNDVVQPCVGDDELVSGGLAIVENLGINQFDVAVGEAMVSKAAMAAGHEDEDRRADGRAVGVKRVRVRLLRKLPLEHEDLVGRPMDLRPPYALKRSAAGIERLDAKLGGKAVGEITRQTGGPALEIPGHAIGAV